jgi:hypothetical protein
MLVNQLLNLGLGRVLTQSPHHIPCNKEIMKMVRIYGTVGTGLTARQGPALKEDRKQLSICPVMGRKHEEALCAELLNAFAEAVEEDNSKYKCTTRENTYKLGGKSANQKSRVPQRMTESISVFINKLA